MRGIHHMLIHLPLTLWVLAAMMIMVRAFSAGKLARTAEQGLVPVLLLSLLGGAAAIISGFLVWPWDASLYSPLARNHILMSVWSMGIWGVMAALLIQGKSALWNGFERWIMVVLALAASLLLLVTGTSGGKIAGIPSYLFAVLDEMGMNIYQTFYLPWSSIAALMVVGAFMALIGLAGRRTQGTGD